MKLNLNVACKIVLTEEGARIWNNQYACVPEQFRSPNKNSGEQVTTQLWCLMEVFGPHIHISMGNVYFEGNNIDFT